MCGTVTMTIWISLLLFVKAATQPSSPLPPNLKATCFHAAAASKNDKLEDT
jgi:hypothetical protein